MVVQLSASTSSPKVQFLKRHYRKHFTKDNTDWVFRYVLDRIITFLSKIFLSPQCLFGYFTSPPLEDISLNWIYSNDNWLFHEYLNCFKAVALWLRMVCYEYQNKAILDWLIFPFFLTIISINLLNCLWFPENGNISFYFKYKSKIEKSNSWYENPVIKREYIERYYIQYWFLHERENTNMWFKKYLCKWTFISLLSEQ